MDNQFNITIVYGTSTQQHIESLSIPRGTTARDALRLSRLVQVVSGLDSATQPIGVFGQLVADDYVVKEGDRVEVYRPLFADPKLARRLRAKAKN